MVDIDTAVTRIMTTSVIVTYPAMSVTDLAALLADNHLTGVPVVENGLLVGIVTEADIVSQLMEIDMPAYGTFLDAIFRFPWDETDDEMRRVLATTAGELMTREVVTAKPDDTVQDAASLLFKRKVNPLPVVDADGQLLGIISRSDIVRLIAQSGSASALPRG